MERDLKSEGVGAVERVSKETPAADDDDVNDDGPPPPPAEPLPPPAPPPPPPASPMCTFEDKGDEGGIVRGSEG